MPKNEVTLEDIQGAVVHHCGTHDFRTMSKEERDAHWADKDHEKVGYIKCQCGKENVPFQITLKLKEGGNVPAFCDECIERIAKQNEAIKAGKSISK